MCFTLIRYRTIIAPFVANEMAAAGVDLDGQRRGPRGGGRTGAVTTAASLRDKPVASFP